MASIWYVTGFQSLTLCIHPGISSAGTKAVEMNTTGNISSESALAACSLLVSNAAMKLTPAKAMPNTPERPRMISNPPNPVARVAPSSTLTPRSTPAMMAASKNSGTISPAGSRCAR